MAARFCRNGREPGYSVRFGRSAGKKKKMSTQDPESAIVKTGRRTAPVGRWCRALTSRRRRGGGAAQQCLEAWLGSYRIDHRRLVDQPVGFTDRQPEPAGFVAIHVHHFGAVPLLRNSHPPYKIVAARPHLCAAVRSRSRQPGGRSTNPPANNLSSLSLPCRSCS